MNNRKKAIFLFSSLIFISISTHAALPSSLKMAKKMAFKIFTQHPKTLFCQCRFNASGRVDLNSCNMQSASHEPGAHQIKWSHMMPVSYFGPQFECWNNETCSKNGTTYQGALCCREKSTSYQQAEMDLYNLWPEVAIVSQLTTAYRYGTVNTNRFFHGCPIKVDSRLGLVEPPSNAKGIIARANLFMADRYDITLSEADKQQFKQWSRQYPPSDWEKAWAESIAATVGYRNHFIDAAIMGVPLVKPQSITP